MFCKGFGNKAKNFIQAVDKVLAGQAAIALSVTAAIKELMNSPVVSVAVLLTKTQVDDEIRDKLLKGLDKAMGSLAIVDACSKLINLDAKLMCFVFELKKVAPELQQAILIKLAALLTAHLDDARKAQNVYDALVQGTYTFNK